MPEKTHAGFYSEKQLGQPINAHSFRDRVLILGAGVQRTTEQADTPLFTELVFLEMIETR